MAVGDAYVFLGFLTPVLTQLFFPKPPTTFPTCFCRGERRKYAGKKSRLSRGSNSQPPGHESDTLTTEPPGRGGFILSPRHVPCNSNGKYSEKKKNPIASFNDAICLGEKTSRTSVNSILFLKDYENTCRPLDSVYYLR